MRDAVLLVLATGGCWHSSAPSTPPPPPAPSATTTTTATTAADPWKPGRVDPRAFEDPAAFCDEYKRRTPADPRKATNSPGSLTVGHGVALTYDADHSERMRRDDAVLDSGSRTVRCRLVRRVHRVRCARSARSARCAHPVRRLLRGVTEAAAGQRVPVVSA